MLFNYLRNLLVHLNYQMLHNIIKRHFGILQRRAAFDIGSGSIKFQIADVDLSQNKIKKTHFKSAEQVLFVNQEQISSQLLDEAISKLNKFIDLSEKYQVESSFGVATQAFRVSSNGQQIIDTLKQKL